MSQTEEKTSEPSPDILDLFKYRNIAWRYLLCFCLPLQQKILIKQLRIAHHRKSSLSEAKQRQKEQKSTTKNIFTNISHLFEDDDAKHFDDDDDIPDFYHLPRISVNELQTLFNEGRQKYEILKKTYITDKQQEIRNEMLRTTAPPSEQYNDPSLRTRSKTITQLIEREDEKSTDVFTRIDLIESDWKSQDEMNKLSQLRSTPPTYSPPKPPPFTQYNNINKQKSSRSRFNTFTADKITDLTQKINIKKKKKKKKTPSDIFKMKVFQSKSNKKQLNETEEMVQIHHPPPKEEKRRFSDTKTLYSRSPFAALSKTGKKKKKRNILPPKTPPPRIGSIAKTPPLGVVHSMPLKQRKKGGKRSLSPLGTTQSSLKNPSLSLETEDADILLEQNEYFSDDHLKQFKNGINIKLKRQRSLSEDDIKYKRHKQEDIPSIRADIASKSSVNLDVIEVNNTASFVDDKHIEYDNNVIDDNAESEDDAGSLMKVTMNDEYEELIEEFKDKRDVNEESLESLVVAAPIHKDKMGTRIISKPSRSAPPINDDKVLNTKDQQIEMQHPKSATSSPIVSNTSHRETVVLDDDDEKMVLDVFEDDTTKPGLFSEDDDDYINIQNKNKETRSRSCSERNEESFGEIVMNHPLNDEDDIDDDDVDITLRKDIHYSQSMGDMKSKYKEERKSGQRPNTMTSFTPYFLRNLHKTTDISDEDNIALWKQIMKDVNRTFQYRDFFRKKTTRHCLGNLLYIWSRINDDIGYLQGMHDLASIITFAIYFDYKIFNDSDNNNDNENNILEELLDPKYLEHDIYSIYSALLSLTVKLFEAAVPQKEDIESTKDEYLNSGLFSSGSNSSLYLKLHYLHHKLLKHFDLTLYCHFESIGISPQLYMLRWIRVLFCREFYLDQIIKLWDELFVSSSLIEFIDYIVMAMINNVRSELLCKKDMSIICLLQNYPKQDINIESLAITARQIQKGEIKFDFVGDNHEFYSHIESMDKMRDYAQESVYLFKEIKDCNTLPDIVIADDDYDYYCNINIRIPGFGDINPTQKYLVKKIILSSFGTKLNKIENGYIRMGYLVKRGSGDQSFFARKNLKIRWFVIDENKKFYYYKNKKSFNKKEEPLRNPINLCGRAIRVVDNKCFCFEISGINMKKRAYLLFAKDFTQFVLWLHALMSCADKSLYHHLK